MVAASSHSHLGSGLRVLCVPWPQTGLYRCRLSLALIAGVCIATDLSAQSQILEQNRRIRAELAAGQSHDYQFDLRAGEYARVVIQQRTVDVAVVCLGPEGQELFAVDSQVVGDAETVEVAAESPGAYRLRITPSELHAPNGRYEITLRDLGAATERNKLRIAAARALSAGVRSRRAGTREGFLRAIAEVESALSYWRAAQDRIEEANALLTLGLLYIEIGDRARAVQNTTDALVIARSTLEPSITGRALEAVARVHNSFGEKRKAIEYCEQALPLLRAADDRSGEGNALDNLGVAWSGIGEKRRALTYFDQSVQIFRALQDRRLLAELAGNMGMIYDSLGEYQRALENHQSSLVLVRELEDRATEAVAINNIGSAYSGLGEYQKALDAYSAALELNQSLDNKWNIAINLNNIAWIYGQFGDRRQALRFYQQSLELVRAARDQRRIASVLNNIGDIYTEFGDYRKAIETHNEALTLRRAVGDREGEANSLNNLGRCYARSGQHERARDYFVRALAIHRRLENRYMLARTLRNLGALQRETGDAERSRSSLDEALQISRQIRDRKGEAEALGELAKVERDRGNFTQGRERADEALTALESVRLAVMSPALRASLIASVRDVQELQIEVLMRLHTEQPEKGFGAAALTASERGRARSLLEMLGESGVGIRSGVDPALLTRQSELERLLSAKADMQTRLLSGKHTQVEAAAAEKEVDAFMMELDQVQSRIRATSPHYAALTYPTPLDLRGLQTSVVDENTVLLEYALGARKSFLWVVSTSSMDIFELPSRSEIEAAARRVYDLMTARNQKPVGETPARDPRASITQMRSMWQQHGRRAECCLSRLPLALEANVC